MIKLFEEREVAYRGERILTGVLGTVSVYPTWLKGEMRIKFQNEAEARAFIDAAIDCKCLEFVGDNPDCHVHRVVEHAVSA